MSNRKNTVVTAPLGWEIVNKYIELRDSNDEKRLADNAEFYCTVFNTYPTGKDDLITKFDVTVSYDQTLNQLRFSLHNKASKRRKADKWTFSIPISSIPADTFEGVLSGKESLGALLFEVLYLSKGEQFDKILTADQFEKSFSSWYEYVQQLGYNDEKRLLNFDDRVIREKLSYQNFVWYYGCSCSGKSYMGIRELSAINNNPRIAYNPCFSADYEYEIVKLMLYHGQNVSLLIDDVQCDTEKAKELFSIIADCKNSFKQRNVFVFLISWADLLRKDHAMLKKDADSESFFSKFVGWFDPVEADADRYISLLKTRIENKRLSDVCGGNLALLNTAGTIVSKRWTDNPERALFCAFVKARDDNKLFSIYKLCVLGTYAYLVDPKSLQSDISSADLTTIKTVDGKYYAGHKEICRFLAAYIEKNAETLGIGYLPKPDALVFEYIQSTESSKQWRAIKQLVDEQGEESLQSVSPIWQGLHYFERDITCQTKKDPTWENAPSSMYFVLKTASLLGVFSDYDKAVNPDYKKQITINPIYGKVISNFCNKFQVTENGIVVRFGEIQTTHDFQKIKEKMIAEDDADTSLLPYEAGESIDCDLAHKNWLLGLVVGLKNELRQVKREDLFSAAVKDLFSLQDPSGFWYPKRVPWITARVLIGLFQAGYSASDHRIKKGIDFLVQALGENDHWEAHTGGWNTPYETSSLCLEAIFNNIGRDVSEYKHQLDRVVNYLLANRVEWMKDDVIVDGTATACCLLKHIHGFDEYQDLFKYIQTLCEERIYNIVPKNPELNLDEKQSCETTQIAWYVMDYCWEYLSANLSDMLNQFVTRSLQTSKEGVNTMDRKSTIFFSYCEDSKTKTVERIQKISAYLRESGYDVKCYADEVVGTNVALFMQNAPNADLILVFGSKSYKEKAMANNGKGSGVLFENLVLSQLFIQNHMDKIIPIAFERGTSFDDSFPPPFGTNKGLKCPAVNDRFLKDLVVKIEKKLGEMPNV